MRYLTIILFLFISASNLSSYPLWAKSFGIGREDLSYEMGAHTMIQNAEGNFLVSGFNVPASGYNFWGRLLLVDQKGDTIWTRKFDFSSLVWTMSGFELFPDQSIYIIANWQNQKDSTEARLFHIGPDGSVISSADLYNPYPENGQECWAMSQNNIGGLDILASGAGNRHSTIRRMDVNGQLVWLTTVGAGVALHVNRDTTNFPCHLIRQPDNGLMVCGWRVGEDLNADSGAYKAFVYKVNSAGEVQWFHTYGFKNSSFGNATSGISCANGENVFLGSQHDTLSSKSKTFVFCIDNTGSVLWERNLLINSAGTVVRELPDSTFEVMGNYWAGSSSSVTGFYILHLSAAGDSLDCKIINCQHSLMNVIAPKEGGLLLGFESLTNGITLWRTDFNGNYAPVITDKMQFSPVIEKKDPLFTAGSTVIFNNVTKGIPQEKCVMEILNLNGRLVSRTMQTTNTSGSSIKFSTGNITAGPKIVIVKNSNGRILSNKIHVFK